LELIRLYTSIFFAKKQKRISVAIRAKKNQQYSITFVKLLRKFMITKTYTYVSFYFTENDFDFQKEFEGDLAYFCKSQPDVNLETYLTQLVALKHLIVQEKVDRIAVFHTLLYDHQCNTEFSPAVVALLHELKANFCISTDRVGQTSLYHTLDKMRKRPGMYLGEATITALSNFISGFYEGCNYQIPDSPSFEGFNDFVGKYYGKHTTAGWKNLILAGHYGNEAEAITQFYELLDEFRLNENRPSSRAIVFKLLQMSYVDFRAETLILNSEILNKNEISENEISELKQQLTKINRIADMLHNVPFQLTNAVQSNKLHYYDGILQDIFEQANVNKGLFELIDKNIPTANFYKYELLQNTGTNILTCQKSEHLLPEITLKAQSKLLKTFFAINNEKANEVKQTFLNK
jgi:hypothetical protein